MKIADSFKKIKLNDIFVVLALLIIIYMGVEFRLLNNNYYIGRTYNVISYYYEKSERLLRDGRFPEQEAWRFAPDSPKENAPPFLAYFSVFSYKIANIFFNNLNFYDFAMSSPILIYVVWSIFGFWAISNLFGRKIYGLFFALLLSIIPAGINLTKFGFYTEEFLGAVLIFFGLHFLLKFAESWKFLNFCFASLFFILLSLTWPQFPIIFLGLLLILLFWYFFGRLKLEKLFQCFGLLMLFAIIAHLVCVYFLGTAYSPISFLREAFIGVITYNSPEIKLAMGRNDWRTLDLAGFINNFGLLMWVLIPAGFIFCVARFKNPKYFTVFIFSLLTISVAFIFTKSRFLAFSPLLFLSVYGSRLFYRQENIERFLSIIKKLLSNFFKNGLSGIIAFLAKNRWKILIILPFIILGGLSIYFIKIRLDFSPNPSIEFLEAPSSIEINKQYSLAIQFKNLGGASLNDKQAFGGLHIEVENAEVKNISVSSPFTKSSVELKPDFQRGNIFWFEAKFLRLKKDEFGLISFNIKPYSEPVNIYYRAWLPGECSREDRLAVLEKLRPEWRNRENTWRSENCLKRLPENSDFLSPFCLIETYAAYQDLQHFRCLKKSF